MEQWQEHDGELGEEPTGKLVHDFIDESKRVLAESSRLLRAEIDSAKQEIRDEAKKVGAPVALLGSGGAVLHAALLMFAVAVGALLTEAMPSWAAFFITAAIFGITGWALVTAGRKRIAAIRLKPEKTIHNLEDDQRWARGLKQRARLNLRHDT